MSPLIFLSLIANVFRKKHEPDWLNRSIEDVAKFADNSSAPSRKFLWSDIVSKLDSDSISTVLEVGSGYGANLIVGNSFFPRITFKGIDLSKASIEFGNRNLKRMNIHNIELIEANTSILPFKDKAIDLTFSDALFLYIDSKSFETVLDECLRVSSTYLVFIEFHSPFYIRKSFRISDGWVHNFRKSLLRNARVKEIELHDFKNVERSGRWSLFGKVIVVHLK